MWRRCKVPWRKGVYYEAQVCRCSRLRESGLVLRTITHYPFVLSFDRKTENVCAFRVKWFLTTTVRSPSYRVSLVFNLYVMECNPLMYPNRLETSRVLSRPRTGDGVQTFRLVAPRRVGRTIKFLFFRKSFVCAVLSRFSWRCVWVRVNLPGVPRTNDA